MVQLMMAYQEERCNIEEECPEAVLLRALNSKKPGDGKVLSFSPAELADVMNAIADERDMEYSEETFTNARKVGRILRNLRFKRGQRTSAGKCWLISKTELEERCSAYGISSHRRRSSGYSDDPFDGSAVSAVTVVHDDESGYDKLVKNSHHSWGQEKTA